MTVKQISVFVENEAGKMAELAEVLYKNDIDMRAMSMAETKDFGILRMIVDDNYKTSCVLKEEGYIFSMTPVLAVEVPDEPGGILKILNVLKEENINLEYMYAFISRKKEAAYMIFRVEDAEVAIKVLKKKGIKLAEQEELSEL
ncbi:MAG: ACT domain-containing protein [Christensenellaceae bacterium]|nr:ACT domain-containing protein [Christensenellaceae bacterium]